jgi:hypothetical protein
MAVNLKALKAYAGGDDAEMEDFIETPEEEAAETEEHEAEESEDVEALEHFVQTVFMYADDISAAANDIAEELNHDDQPSDEAEEQMLAQLGAMPEEVQSAVKDYCKGMEYEDVLALATQLSDAEHLDNPEQVAGWLYWCAKNV